MQVYVNQHDFFMNKIREHVDHSDILHVSSSFLLFSLGHNCVTDGAQSRTQMKALLEPSQV